MMLSKVRILVAVSFFIICTGEASAEILATYTFPLTNYGSTTTAAGVTAGAVTNNGLPTIEIANYGYATDPVLRIGPKAGGTTAATAVSTGSYVYFTLTPTTGNKIHLTSLTFNIARGGTGGQRGYVVRSSLDGYAANIQTANVVSNRPTWTSVTVDLSGVTYRHLLAAVTFRLYIYTPATTSTLEWDDITVNGSVENVNAVFFGTVF